MQISTIDKFDHIAYLLEGTTVQRAAHQVLSSIQIFPLLAAFNPLLVGTIPIDIAVEKSDLDIICEAKDLDHFQQTLASLFSNYEQFTCTETLIQGIRTILANFYVAGFEIEIFGQDVPVKMQNGYRHMIKEYEILTNRGHEFRDKVIALKTKGIKTEPAFAQLLKIEGDPYEGLLSYRDI